jgi:hypothetical protein
MTEKKSFLDAIKAAQAQKNHSGVPDTKSQEVQQVKYGNKPALNKPVKKAAGRGR